MSCYSICKEFYDTFCMPLVSNIYSGGIMPRQNVIISQRAIRQIFPIAQWPVHRLVPQPFYTT